MLASERLRGRSFTAHFGLLVEPLGAPKEKKQALILHLSANRRKCSSANTRVVTESNLNELLSLVPLLTHLIQSLFF